MLIFFRIPQCWKCLRASQNGLVFFLFLNSSAFNSCISSPSRRLTPMTPKIKSCQHSVAYRWQQSYVSRRSNYLKLVVEQRKPAFRLTLLAESNWLKSWLLKSSLTASHSPPHKEKWLKVTIIQVWKLKIPSWKLFYIFYKRYGLELPSYKYF